MINFNLTFESNPDISLTQAQKNAARLAAKKWGSQFANDATVDLTIESESNRFSQTLMSARSEITNNPDPGFGDVEVLRNKALSGVDLNGDEQDGNIRINWGVNWELDFDETPNKTQEEYDFYSTFYHELNHNLGFISFIEPNGLDPYTSTGAPGSWSAFDEFITDGDGKSVVDNKGQVDGATYRDLLKGGSSKDNRSGLFFSGDKAKAANGGFGVGLYTPDVALPLGIGHLDDENPALAGSLMLSATAAGPSAREMSKLEKAIFEDLGYSFDETSSTGSKSDVPTDVAEIKAVEVTTLNSGDTITLQLEKVEVSGVSELRVFKVDDASGRNKEQISSISILKGNQLPSSYLPALTLDKNDVAVGQFLQFELVENGETRIAAPTRLGDGNVSLDFGSGTVFTFEPTTQDATTNLLKDDAAAIDLSAQPESVTLNFSVYREAAFNNTVGFYSTDAADGSIITDSLLGTRLRPGDEGYRDAAIARALDTRLTGENDKVSTFSADLFDQDFLGAFLVADGSDLSDGEIFFSHLGANSNGNDHVKLLGDNTFGFEDLAGLGDKDYNDVVVKFEVA